MRCSSANVNEQSSENALQLDSPERCMFLGGAGKLSTTSWASWERWTMTSLSLTAVCIRRTLSASGAWSVDAVSFFLLPEASELPAVGAEVGDGVGELSWMVRSSAGGLGDGASTETVGTAGDSDASPAELAWCNGRLSSDCCLSIFTSARPVSSDLLSLSSTYGETESSWNLTLILLPTPDRLLIEWRCWSTTACTCHWTIQLDQSVLSMEKHCGARVGWNRRKLTPRTRSSVLHLPHRYPSIEERKSQTLIWKTMITNNDHLR